MATRTRTIIIGEAGPESIIKADPLEQLLDPGPTPGCQNIYGCPNRAVWNMHRWCGCQLLLCNTCLVALRRHWGMLEAGDEFIDQSSCPFCHKVKPIEPWEPLEPQLVLRIELL